MQCKSFDWFIQNYALDVFKNFPRLPPNVHWGEVRHSRTGTCLDSGGSQPPSTVSLSHCHGVGGNQLFRLNEKGQLGMGERCIDANRDKMTLIYCKLGTVDGPWIFDEVYYLSFTRNYFESNQKFDLLSFSIENLTNEI